ncbi:alpha/beta fold hydrolase [Vulgatibacter sp.]|uniref:alpha/beta fold hydrolase n=1 Tax=Vulgatibacter sp. TaxID=1971226 RepID=UPI0035694C5F
MAATAPIFALHAGGTTPALWDPVRRAAPDLAFVTPDLNHIAELLPGDATYADLVDELRNLVPPGPVVLAGATIGARLALSVASTLGERLQALYLLTPTPVVEDQAFLAKLAGLRRFMMEGFSAAQVEVSLPVMLYRWGPRFTEAADELRRLLHEGAGPRGMALARRCENLGPQPKELLATVDAPIEVLFGGADPVLEMAWPDSWREVPQVRSVEVLPDASHQLVLQIPGRIAADLRRLATLP